MTDFKQFNITTVPFDTDTLSGLLWGLDIDGITEENNSLSVFVSDLKSLDLAGISSFLQSLISDGIIESYSVEELRVQNRNWNEEWEKTINVVKVTDRIVIKPTFRDYEPEPGQIVILIDPKMSFGTGEHQTTKLMIKMIEKYMRPGYKIIDVGSGTAVLALTAVKLGASSAIAIDNDEWCYMNGTENCKLNDADSVLSIRMGEIKDIEETEFDLVLANINKHILIEIKDGLSSKLSHSGTLILSGLLKEDEADIVSEFGALNLITTDKEIMDEWMSITFKKM